MTIRGIIKPPRAYTPKHLVSGFCVPTKVGEGEQLVCEYCVALHRKPWGDIETMVPVTFDGEVHCSRCKQVL